MNLVAGFIRDVLDDWKNTVEDGDEPDVEGFSNQSGKSNHRNGSTSRKDTEIAARNGTTVIDKSGDYSSQRKISEVSVTAHPKIAWHRPRTFNDNGEAKVAADDFMEKRTIILNLEDIDKRDARRFLDFLSGVAYSNQGIVRKIAVDTYLFGPVDMDFSGDDLLTAMGDIYY